MIRPMCTVPEQELIRYADELEIPVIPCNLCGSQPEQRNRCPSQLMSQKYSNFEDLAEAKRQS